jgi:hypothetical protein
VAERQQQQHLSRFAQLLSAPPAADDESAVVWLAQEAASAVRSMTAATALSATATLPRSMPAPVLAASASRVPLLHGAHRSGAVLYAAAEVVTAAVGVTVSGESEAAAASAAEAQRLRAHARLMDAYAALRPPPPAAGPGTPDGAASLARVARDLGVLVAMESENSVGGASTAAAAPGAFLDAFALGDAAPAGASGESAGRGDTAALRLAAGGPRGMRVAAAAVLFDPLRAGTAGALLVLATLERLRLDPAHALVRRRAALRGRVSAHRSRRCCCWSGSWPCRPPRPSRYRRPLCAPSRLRWLRRPASAAASGWTRR